MAIQEIFKRMQAGEVAAHSELGSRDEAKQTRQYTVRLQKFKATVGVKAHALVMKDVVIPFNPFTGEPDDTYNEKNKFRPILLVSQVLSGIKGACAEDAGLAAKWEKHLGVEAGKVDWAAEPTMDDYRLFKAAGMIAPRVMTYATVSLNFNGSNGFSQYRQKYTVDPTQLDEGYMYPQGKSPIHNDAASFFYSMLKPEFAEKEEALKKKAASKEQISAMRREVYSKSPVGFAGPTNLIPFIYLPMDSVPKSFEEDSFSDFESLIRWYGYASDKWGGGINECMENNLYDENMDYFDLTLRTPSASEQKSDGTVYTDEDSIQLYNAMTIVTTDARSSIWHGATAIDGGNTVQNAEAFAFVWKAAEAYFAHSQEESFKGGETFEKLMAVSNRFRPLDTVMDSFLAACNDVFVKHFADTKYFTDDIKKAHAKFLVAMNKDHALAMAEVDEDELNDAALAQQKSLSSLVQEVRGATGEDSLQEMNLEIQEG